MPGGISWWQPGHRYALLAAAPLTRLVAQSPSGPLSRRSPPRTRSTNEDSPSPGFWGPLLRRGALRRGLTVQAYEKAANALTGHPARVTGGAASDAPR